MSRVVTVLSSRAIRERVCRWVMNAPLNARVTIAEPKRSLPQNDRMHAMLTDIALQTTHHGVKLGKDDWKLLFLDSLWRQHNAELQLVPNLDGTGFVPLSGRSSSDLSKQEMSDLIEILFAFGAERGIEWSEPEQQRAAA